MPLSSNDNNTNNGKMQGPALFDGSKWISITEDDDKVRRDPEHNTNNKNVNGNETSNESEQQQQQQQQQYYPVRPIINPEDESIFISIVSYRDGERCGETIKSIYENAKNPKLISIGLIEQNSPEDKFCLEVYCNYYDPTTTIVQRQQVQDTIKIYKNTKFNDSTCPYYNQIRHLATYDEQAKGPIYARSLTRKVLQNEEYCMQIDSHTKFIQNWDVHTVEQWKLINNEFGILSTIPAPLSDYHEISSNNDNSNVSSVPRQCSIKFLDNGYPDYQNPADGKVIGITKPLLSHGWSAGFSFAKCHFEESVPYDPFLYWAFNVEQFSRYVRAWTRGYDTYTPTINIVYHDYKEPTNGHGNKEWYSHVKDRYRKQSIQRVKIAAQIPILDDGSDSLSTSETIQANLGLYGIGKRRSLHQLNTFLQMDIQNSKQAGGANCTGHQWVPYDPSIPPTMNLHTNPDNLDPQPEYPQRTKFIYYNVDTGIDINNRQDDDIQAEVARAGITDHQIYHRNAVADTDDSQSQQQQQYHHHHHHHKELRIVDPIDELPSIYALAWFWIIGLVAWYVLFALPRPKSKQRRGPTPPLRVQPPIEIPNVVSDDGFDKDT